MSKSEKHARVEALIMELGLKGCADSLIGDAHGGEVGQGGRRGISGGERRRVSVAIQLLTNPSMLLCDEVTSGLDSFSSLEVVKTLTTFAQASQKSVILAIHQPRAEMFKLLSEARGQIVVMSNGDVVYSGAIRGILGWLESIGKVAPCAVDMNPFDYILDSCVTDFTSEESELASKAQRDRLVRVWAAQQKALSEGKAFVPEPALHPSTPISPVYTLLNRSYSCVSSTSTSNIINYDDSRLKGSTDDTISAIQEKQTPTSSHLHDNGRPESVYSTVSSLEGNNGANFEPPTVWQQVVILTRRGWINQKRDSIFFWVVLAINVLLGLLVGTIFWKLGGEQSDIRARASIAYILVAFQPFLSMIIGIYRGAAEMKIYEREHGYRWYGPLPFLVSNWICSIPSNVIHPAAYSLIIYYMAGLRTDSLSYVGMYTAITILFQMTISTFAVFCTSVNRDFDAATLVGSTIYLPFTMSAGYIVATSQIPKVLGWIRYLSFIRLGYQTLVSVEFTDNRFDCPYATLTTPPPTHPTPENRFTTWDPVLCGAWDGNRILVDHLEVPVHYFPSTIAMFLFHIGAYLLFSWLILWSKPANHTKAAVDASALDYVTSLLGGLLYRKKQKTDVKEKETKEEEEEVREDVREDGGEEEEEDEDNGKDGSADAAQQPLAKTTTAIGNSRVDMFSQGLVTRDPVTIRIENLSVSMKSSQWKVKQRELPQEDQRRQCTSLPSITHEVVTRTLLQEIDFVIPPGQLTAIMGGSGSGKTTLLNTLSRRNPAMLKATGDIYFNSTRNPSLHQVNTVCSYVRQGDGFLMSHLTVRETLRYAAELGMGTTLSRLERYAKVEEILDLVGLRECADVMVGSADSNGISGGQRRRVSIGMQLVLEPAVLFLDEPTCGLDAVTAMSVVQTLKKVASVCGRTVVCTIHQPRYDIWKEFDNVMLLLTGGRLAFAGKAGDIIEHFAKAGHVVPDLVNPPDFIIDTVSVNFRTAELERSSRARVEHLAELYKSTRAQQMLANAPTLSNDDINNPHNDGGASIDGQVPQFASVRRATPILIRRSFNNLFRQKGRYFNRVFQPLVVLIMALVFIGRLNHSHNEVLDRLGLFQQLMNITLAALMANIDIFPREVLALTFMAGFMVSKLPPLLMYVNKVSVFKYASVVLALNEFSTLEFHCTEDMRVSGTCALKTGKEAIELLGFENESVGRNAAMVVAMMVLYRLLAWVVLSARMRAHRH
ncbi:hypothetical protein BGZ94_010107 [Podila epigama]|nr:hypothetical protein BGZ94_010107 [Podila epigama]